MHVTDKCTSFPSSYSSSVSKEFISNSDVKLAETLHVVYELLRSLVVTRRSTISRTYIPQQLDFGSITSHRLKT